MGYTDTDNRNRTVEVDSDGDLTIDHTDWDGRASYTYITLSNEDKINLANDLIESAGGTV